MATLAIEGKQPDPAGEDAAGHHRAVMEACPDPLIAIAVDGRITDANPAAVRLTGMAREKLVGSSFSTHFTEPEMARASHREVLSRGLLSGFALAIRQASKETTHLNCNAAVYRDPAGQIEGVVLIARDVTRQKQREEELARIHAETAEYVQELKHQELEFKRINEFYDILQTCTSQLEAYPIIGSVASQLFPGASGALAVSAGRIRQMETVAQWGSEALMAECFAVDDCWALRRGQIQDVADPRGLQMCRHFQQVPSGPSICLPLTVRGELQGLLHLRSAAPFHPQQRQLLITLGEVVKLSLSSLKLRDALRAQAIRDPLTGLFNRNYLDETLRRELSRSMRRHLPLCVAMMDLDGFKAFNDTYSHLAGDQVLKTLGDFFLMKLRVSDIACRYGGDEFVLVLPDSDLTQVAARLNQLRAEARLIECRYGGRQLPSPSVSIGVAQWPDHGATGEELIKAADHALYSAKRNGRDQVGVFGAQPPDHHAASGPAGGG